jgi:hypothetical protein
VIGGYGNGGYVYRGKEIPQLQGKYVFSDFLDGRFWTIDTTDVRKVEQLDLNLTSVSSFGEDESGELYVVTYRGELLKFTSTP